MATHISGVLESCSRSLYALRILRSHGLPESALHEVTRATTLARLLYASPAWWGFASVSDRTRVQRFLQRTIRMGYLPPALPDAAVLVAEAETAGFGRPAASSRSSTTIPSSNNPTPRLASPST